jgi:hypothetical protein
MSIISSFQPMGKTHKANATTTSLTITADGPCQQLLVSSHESTTNGKPIYFVISNLSNVTVTAPAAGAPSYSMLVCPGQQIVYTVNQQLSPGTNLYIAFITESTTGECYFTPGEGK